MNINYEETKIIIQDIATDLTSIVSINIHDYTHQPTNVEISDRIDKTIIELKRLRNKLDY